MSTAVTTAPAPEGQPSYLAKLLNGDLSGLTRRADCLLPRTVSQYRRRSCITAIPFHADQTGP